MTSNNYTQELHNNSFYGQYDCQGDFQYAPEIFIDYNSAIFQEDDSVSCASSNLQKASKKISKAAPITKSSQKSSHKRSKRARNPWTPKEDAQLMELMKKYGQSWAMISSVLVGRTGKQVRDRYLNKLRPNIKCGDWSSEEDERLVALCKEIGNRWSLIATHLPGRTEGQVKNRYYSYIKKRLLPNGTLSQTATSRDSSEGYTSLATSPEAETVAFDFAQELNFSMMNGQMNYSTEVAPNMVKGLYVTEETYSDLSTTQSPTSQKSSYSPFGVDLADPTDVISYEAPYFFRQTSAGVFNFAPIHHDSQVDEMLTSVTDYFQNASNMTSSVDSYFANDLQSEENNHSPFALLEADSTERYTQLSQRKAYLELALAKTLKEIKGL
jgi:hypothetical protein